MQDLTNGRIPEEEGYIPNSVQLLVFVGICHVPSKLLPALDNI